MPYKTLAEINTTEGLHQVFIYVNDVTQGLFMRLVLVGLLIITTMSIYISQKRSNNEGDFASAFAIASYFVTGASFLFYLIPGMLDLYTPVALLVVSGISTLWLFMSKER